MNHNHLKGTSIVKEQDVFITTQIWGLADENKTIERITFIVSIIFQNLSPRRLHIKSRCLWCFLDNKHLPSVWKYTPVFEPETNTYVCEATENGSHIFIAKQSK